jgi:hypothetical protein
MRYLFEDALLVYRQEADSLLTVIAVTAVSSLVLLIGAALSLTFALASIPLFITLYLFAFCVCLQWSGTMATSRPSTRGWNAWLELVQKGPAVIYAAGPGCVLVMLVTASGVVAADAGFWYLAFPVGALGLFAGAQWMLRHVYDVVLIVLFDARAQDAIDIGGQMTDGAYEWSSRVTALVSLPLAAAGTLAIFIGFWLAPLAGAALFVLVLAAWLPFCALVLTNACQRLLDEMHREVPLARQAVS